MANTPQLQPESQFPIQAIQETVQDFPKAAENLSGSMQLLFTLATAGDTVTQWGYNVIRRDQELREFWPKESNLAGAVSNVCLRNAAYRWKIKHPSSRVEQAVTDMLTSALGPPGLIGWTSFETAGSQDFYTTDNGRFVELIRDPGMDANSAFKAERAPVIGIAHLDSGQSTRTGDPEFPVIYTDRNGQTHRLHWYEVIPFCEMPSPIQRMNGVGICLHRDATVLMADGSYRRIFDLVKSKSTEEVMSLDDSGNLAPRRIVNWYTNDLGNRKMVNIRGAMASLCQGVQRRNSWVTEDHPILTPTGWVKAGELRTGDKIVSSLPAPNEEQNKFLVGTLLGDGSFVNQRNRPRFTMGHALAQEEWFDIKSSILEKDFGFTKRSGTAFLKATEKSYPMIHGQTHSHASFINMYETFYPAGKKVVPIELVERYLSPTMLAAWYLDDGHIVDREENDRNRRPHARISTDGFTVNDVISLCDLLTEHGYECGPISARGNPDRRALRFTANGSEKLFKAIAAYIPPSLAYKVPRKYEHSYDKNSWDLGRATRAIDTVITKTDKITRWTHNTVYCIDVEETHNFVTAGIVVHNCAISRVLRVAQIMYSAATLTDEMISGRNVRKINIVGGVSRTDIDDAKKRTQEQADNRGNTRFIEHVILASLDPEKQVSSATIDLAEFPPDFNFDIWMKWYISTLALGFAVDYQEFAPLPGGNIGSSAQSEVLNQKSNAKGPATYQRTVTEKFKTYGVLPRGATMEYEDTNQAEELEKQAVRTSAMEEYALALRNGVLTPEAVRKDAVRRGIYESETVEGIIETYGNDIVAPKQNIGATGGNTTGEDASRTDTGAQNNKAGNRLQKAIRILQGYNDGD